MEREDLISRQAAIDALERNWTPDCEFGGILADVPSAQPDLSDYSDKLWKAAYERGKAEAQRWIPVSERLPEIGVEVLTCLDNGMIEINSLYVYRVRDGELKWENPCGYMMDFADAVAWMPLPEPYKEETK